MPCFLSWSHFPKQSQGLWSNKRLLALHEFRPLKEAVQIGRLNHAWATFDQLPLWERIRWAVGCICRTLVQAPLKGRPRGRSDCEDCWFTPHTQETPCFRLSSYLEIKIRGQDIPAKPLASWLRTCHHPSLGTLQEFSPSVEPESSVLPFLLLQMSCPPSCAGCHLWSNNEPCPLHSPRWCILLCEMNAWERPP